jgi:putative transcriptional regulator
VGFRQKRSIGFVSDGKEVIGGSVGQVHLTVQERKMKKSDFDGLVASLNEAGEFFRTGKLKGGRIHIPAEIDAAAIRARTGLSQINFANQIGVSVATLRNWEQGRRVPDGPAQVLLRMLNQDPNIVRRTLLTAA